MDDSITLESVIAFLLETELFRDLEPIELGDVVKIMQIQTFADKQELFCEGDQGDAWFVIFGGEAEVSKSTAFGPPRLLVTLGAHACFGEMAVLDGSARSATVTAVGEVTVFRFPKDAFDELLGGGNLAVYKLILAMARVLCERQRSITAQFSDLMGDESLERRAIENQLGLLLDKYHVSE